jgi:hypothetical protein
LTYCSQEKHSGKRPEASCLSFTSWITPIADVKPTSTSPYITRARLIAATPFQVKISMTRLQGGGREDAICRVGTQRLDGGLALVSLLAAASKTHVMYSWA